MAHLLQTIINFFKPNKESPGGTAVPSPDFSHLYKPSNTFDEEFHASLCTTIKWTGHIINSISGTSNIDYSTILRQTNPIYQGKPFYDFSCEGSPAPARVPFDYAYILHEILMDRKHIDWSDNQVDASGRILVFEIDLTTYDGAPVANSDGFVDEADIPPIDTWFYITKKHLYCWIPALFIPVMQNAIDVEVYGSYTWLQDTNPDVNSQILEEVKRRLIQNL